MRPFAVFLHSSRYDRVFQAASLLLTASAMDRRCYLFLFYEALATFMDGSWDSVGITGGDDTEPDWTRALQRGFEMAEVLSPYEMVDRARAESGGLEVYACSTSIRMLGLEPADVRERVDHIAGLATMLEVVEDGEMIYI